MGSDHGTRRSLPPCQPEAAGRWPDRAAAFYDEYADREWAASTTGEPVKASLAIHSEYLRRYIDAGDAFERRSGLAPRGDR